MASGSEVLSQRDIDAILSGDVPQASVAEVQVPSEFSYPPPKADEVSPSPVLPGLDSPETAKDSGVADASDEEMHGPSPSGSDKESKEFTVSRLAASAGMTRTGTRGDRPAAAPEMGAVLGRLQERVRVLTEQVEMLKRGLNQVEVGLQATPGYEMHRTFTCGACQTTGLAAVRAKCTQCGQEFWWGWYPEKG